jgi:Tfp pilus assembly protein PilF
MASGNLAGRNTVPDRASVFGGRSSFGKPLTGGKLPTGNRAAFGAKPVINEPFVSAQMSNGYNGSQNRMRPDGSAGKFTPTPIPAVAGAEKGTGSRKSNDTKIREGARLFNMKKPEAAIQELLMVDPALLQREDRVELSYYLGLSFMRQGKAGDALPCLEKVVADGDDLLRVYQCRMALAYIHVTTGRPKMAQMELDRLVEDGFESVQLFNTMAYAAYARKHYRHSIEFYGKALKLDENNATALNGLGYVLADTGIDTARGLELCRRAVELCPENTSYMDSLGWACYKCNEHSQAKGWLRKALDLAPQESLPQIKEHLLSIGGGFV